jgi:hypothetical protein
MLYFVSGSLLPVICCYSSRSRRDAMRGGGGLVQVNELAGYNVQKVVSSLNNKAMRKE